MKPRQTLIAFAMLTNPIVTFFLVMATIVGLMRLSLP
jgi:hypothetical protein